MLKEIMKTMNKLYRMNIKEINREDVRNLFGYDAESIEMCFDRLGINHYRVADLWNVEVRYFTKDEQSKILMYAEILSL